MAESSGSFVAGRSGPGSTSIGSPDAYRTLTTGYAGPNIPMPVASGSGASTGNSSSGNMTMSISSSGSTSEESASTTVIVNIDADMALDGKVDDELICSICTYVMREPQLVVRCGHHFCMQCLTKNKATRSECALCRGEITSQPGEVVPDLSLARRINDIKIKCESSELGCQWTGSIGEYANHCRSGDCQVQCPNKCGVSISRTQVDEHLENNCPRAIVNCTFSRVGTGCKIRVHRSELHSHLRHSILEHQMLLCQSVDMLTANVWMAASTPHHERQTVFTWVFNDFKRYLDGSKNRLFSEPFYVGPCDSGYRLVLRVETGYQDDAVSTFYCVAKGKNDDRLDWPFRRPVTFQALHSSTHKVVVQDRSMPPTRDESIRLITARPKTERNKRGWGRATFVPFKRLDEVGVLTSNSFVLRIMVPWSEMPEQK